MCYDNCGSTIQNALNKYLTAFKTQHALSNAFFNVDVEPQALGVHRLIITIESDHADALQYVQLSKQLKQEIRDVGFDVLDDDERGKKETSQRLNWINILINLVAIASIIALSIAFPPSLPLMIGLTLICFVTTAWTARHYIQQFFRNIRHNNWFNMPTSITLAWGLSLGHTLYHMITMPLMMDIAMTFMNFIMPMMLVGIINIMDEIKRWVLSQSKKMHIQGMASLFPNMADEYMCCELSNDELKQCQAQILSEVFWQEKIKSGISKKKFALQQDMVIVVKQGTCFPVDGIILAGTTRVDASILTGEPQQRKAYGDAIPAGAMNLQQDVIMKATTNSYNSTINRILLSSNRARKEAAITTDKRFFYLYSALIIIGVTASLITPVALGFFTVPLLLQTLMGIMFAICPCTIAIAHYLPELLGTATLSNKSILLRDQRLYDYQDDIHTVVFDKTGTLTTEKSRVHESRGIEPGLWQRIYLLEKKYGCEHPLAKAICEYYESQGARATFTEIDDDSVKITNCGLSARVQEKLIHIGNADYLRQYVEMPTQLDDTQGFTPVYVAENKVYRGVIYIQHDIRPGVIAALRQLKSEKKRLILLTGDTRSSAMALNHQLGGIFEENNIHAGQKSEDKNAFFKKELKSATGVWFVGDGLNDSLCARTVSEQGGISCAMTSTDKSAFFTDISLNGSLDYLFEYKKINHALKKNVMQNQGLLAYGAVIFLAFVIALPIVGLSVSPLIPVVIMVSTTVTTLFNSYRMKIIVDCALDKKPSWLQRCLASDASIGLLMGGCTFLILGLFIATLSCGYVALPGFLFTAGVAAAVSSGCVVAAIAMFAGFAGLGVSYLGVNKTSRPDDELVIRSRAPSLTRTIHTRGYEIVPNDSEAACLSNTNNTNASQNDMTYRSSFCIIL